MAIHTNRVFDTVDGAFVEWDTQPDPDPSGSVYPGSGTFGVQTSDYVVSRRQTTADNFSWKTVQADNEITVEADQQMLVSGGFNVYGPVNLFGEIILL